MPSLRKTGKERKSKVSQFRITVLKVNGDSELAEEYCLHGAKAAPCTAFEEGQVFITENLDQPKDFCTWAWDDIFKYITLLHCGGSMSDHMKYKDIVIACCTDGIRPVVFKIEKIKS